MSSGSTRNRVNSLLILSSPSQQRAASSPPIRFSPLIRCSVHVSSHLSIDSHLLHLGQQVQLQHPSGNLNHQRGYRNSLEVVSILSPKWHQVITLHSSLIQHNDQAVDTEATQPPGILW